MGQIWEVINVDRRERDLAGGTKLQGLFFYEDMGKLYHALWIPRMPKVVDKWLSHGPIVSQPSSLIGKLSTEELDMIFEAILPAPAVGTEGDLTANFLSCIFLAICCKRLLAVGKPHILRGYIAREARAADCRLVCLGEYAGSDDQAPPGMLTEAELKEIATTKMVWEDGDIAEYGEERRDKLVMERRLHIFAVELYTPLAKVWRALDGALSDKLYDSREELGSACSLDRDMITALAGQPTYRSGPNVLYNLVKGEYVREDELVVCGKDPKNVTLVHALLSRICYSSDWGFVCEICGSEVASTFKKGPWAGDRFCIRSARDGRPVLKAGAGFTEWRDVTKEVNVFLRQLWKGVMGEDSPVEEADHQEEENGEESGEDSESDGSE
ncbi:hypothetical protein LXA43DRAFT_1178937 [Ganoderma leucocontextum]|nr:hypothetical protein LXA43DRAFT_1178937 [Ganoderma leucocontextum]